MPFFCRISIGRLWAGRRVRGWNGPFFADVAVGRRRLLALPPVASSIRPFAWGAGGAGAAHLLPFCGVLKIYTQSPKRLTLKNGRPLAVVRRPCALGVCGAELRWKRLLLFSLTSSYPLAWFLLNVLQHFCEDFVRLEVLLVQNTLARLMSLSNLTSSSVPFKGSYGRIWGNLVQYPWLNTPNLRRWHICSMHTWGNGGGGRTFVPSALASPLGRACLDGSRNTIKKTFGHLRPAIGGCFAVWQLISIWLINRRALIAKRRF